ncbi:MAG TPA: hypothetical protein V6D29_25370 [Leptolyngbyaceae cyanobacterium]
MKHLIQYVMSYPSGYVPPAWEVPEGYVPDGSIEDYDVGFSEKVPEVGQQFEHYGDTWTIAQVQTYQPVESLETATKYFHVVICSWDGSVPPRSQWDGGASPLLVIHASPGGELAVDEDSEVAWEIVMREEWISPHEGWQITNLQRFEPVGERLPGDFDRVVVAWSLTTVNVEEDPVSQAA